MTLNKQVAAAYVLASIVVALLLSCLWLYLNRQAVKAEEANPPPAGSKAGIPEKPATEKTVVVELMPPPEPPKSSGGSLATNQDGKGKEAATTAATTKTNPDKKTPSQDGELVVRPTDKPKTPETQPATERAATKGNLPPITYLGEVELLLKEFPRIEVAWIHESIPEAGKELPPVLWQVVVDQEGNVGAQNCKTYEKKGSFTLVTANINCNERIMAVKVNKMTLWSQRNEVLQGLKLSISDDMITYGYYRSSGETYLLKEAVGLYNQAVGNGLIKENKLDDKALQITIKKNQQGKPDFSRVEYREGGGVMVKLH
ncbi:MAG: hypothetical protein NTV55_01500 [Planctomycetota bacterium]|nr:hypothetical protein [Planctomycetota bacterium]